MLVGGAWREWWTTVEILTSACWGSSLVWRFLPSPALVMQSEGKQSPNTDSAGRAALDEMNDLYPDCRATQLSDWIRKIFIVQINYFKHSNMSFFFLSRAYTPFFLSHHIAVQDFQIQTPAHDVRSIIKTWQGRSRHNAGVAHYRQLLQLMKWCQVRHLNTNQKKNDFQMLSLWKESCIKTQDLLHSGPWSRFLPAREWKGAPAGGREQCGVL